MTETETVLIVLPLVIAVQTFAFMVVMTLLRRAQKNIDRLLAVHEMNMATIRNWEGVCEMQDQTIQAYKAMLDPGAIHWVN